MGRAVKVSGKAAAYSLCGSIFKELPQSPEGLSSHAPGSNLRCFGPVYVLKCSLGIATMLPWLAERIQKFL